MNLNKPTFQVGCLSSSEIKPQDSSRPVNWVVAYRFNGELIEEGFEFQVVAFGRMLELDIMDLAPTLHEVSSKW